MWIWAAQGGVTNTSNPPRLSCFYITQTRACEFNNINVLTHTYIDGTGWQKHPWVGNRSSPVCVPCLLQTHSCCSIHPKLREERDRVDKEKKKTSPPILMVSFHTYITLFAQVRPCAFTPPRTLIYFSCMLLWKKTNTAASENICAVDIAELITHWSVFTEKALQSKHAACDGLLSNFQLRSLKKD